MDGTGGQMMTAGGGLTTIDENGISYEHWETEDGGSPAVRAIRVGWAKKILLFFKKIFC